MGHRRSRGGVEGKLERRNLPMSLRHRLRFQHRRFRRQWVPLVAEMTVGRVLTKIRGRQSHTERDSEGEQVERAVGRASCDEELRRGW